MYKKWLWFGIGAVLAGCGGGGSDNGGGGGGNNPPVDPPGPVVPTISASCIDPVTAKVAPGAAVNYETGDAEGAFGEDGGGSDGAGDGNGNNGQFLNTRVRLYDKNMKLVGETMTDERGSVSIDLNGCTEPVQISFVGGNGAAYYDEATKQVTPFPAGREMRMRLSTLSGSFSVTPYTEASVRYLEAGDPATAMDGDRIDSANRLVSEVLSDQVPGFLRKNKAGEIDLIPVGRVTKPLNAQSAFQLNSLTDTVAGRRGAVVAGFIEGAGSLLADAPATALIVGDQLANDLTDGRLDLQGAAGPVLAPGESPAYTYDSLWRSQSIGAGVTLEQAGDQSLRQQTTTAAVTDITSSSTLFYDVQLNAVSSRAFATFGGQRVRLYANGRLTISRGMGGDIIGAFPSSSDSANPREIDVPGGPFVDVKVGGDGNVIALTQNRDRIVHIAALRLFEGTAAQVNQSFDAIRAVMDGLVGERNLVGFEIPTLHGGAKRVVSFAPSPADRSVSAGPASDFLYVLNDGSLWGGQTRSPQTPISVPAPAPGLLSVAYDKFVPPAFDPAYGNGPTSAVQVPFTGPRRLYGLTRDGQVKVWLEGEDASGVTLAIPGHVVSLASESRSNIYGLTSEGNVLWLNADQALAAAPGTIIGPRPALENYNRRYALNHVEPVNIGEKICWIARSEAAACNSGNAYQWSESTVRFQATGANAVIPDRAVMPSLIGPAAQLGQAGGLWRMTGIEERYSVQNGRSDVTQGMTYLFTDGRVSGPQALLGQRDFAQPICDSSGGNCVNALRADELARALNSVFRGGGPLTSPIQLNSTFSTDRQPHALSVSVQPVGGQSYQLVATFDNGATAEMPTLTFDLDLLTVAGFGEPAGLQLNRLRGGDILQNGQVLSGDAYFPASPESLITMDRSAAAWFGSLNNPVSSEPGGADFIQRLIPQYTADRYGMRVCFGFETQTSATRSRFGGLICTVHDNFGNFQDVSAVAGVTYFDAQGNQLNSLQTDFGHRFPPWPQ